VLKNFFQYVSISDQLVNTGKILLSLEAGMIKPISSVVSLAVVTPTTWPSESIVGPPENPIL